MGIQNASTELFLTTCQESQVAYANDRFFQFSILYSMRYQWLGAWTRDFEFWGSYNDKSAHIEKTQDTQSGRSRG